MGWHRHCILCKSSQMSMRLVFPQVLFFFSFHRRFVSGQAKSPLMRRTLGVMILPLSSLHFCHGSILELRVVANGQYNSRTLVGMKARLEQSVHTVDACMCSLGIPRLDKLASARIGKFWLLHTVSHTHDTPGAARNVRRVRPQVMVHIDQTSTPSSREASPDPLDESLPNCLSLE